MTLQPRLLKAGKYPVEWVPRPYYADMKVDPKAAPCGILHTEEGSFDGSETVFKVHYAPTFTVGIHLGKPTIWQHVPVGVIALACRGHNDQSLVEIELEGSSKQTLWLPDPVRLDLLASLMLACLETYGIPLTHPWADGDYGKAGDNPHRHAGKLGKVAGWYGHGDMPPLDVHWDPGALQWSKVFAHAHDLDAIAKLPPKPPAVA